MMMMMMARAPSISGCRAGLRGREPRPWWDADTRFQSESPPAASLCSGATGTPAGDVAVGIDEEGCVILPSPLCGWTSSHMLSLFLDFDKQGVAQAWQPPRILGVAESRSS